MNSKAGEYYIERLSADNITDVEKLHTAVYNRVPPRNFFFTKYNTAFTGVEYTGFIAYNKQRLPVSFRGVIPCFIQFNDKIILAAQAADAMTHPDYRKQGLLAELASHTFQLCRSSGIEVIFGFPNQNSYPILVNKLGWQPTERMGCFIIPSGSFIWQRLFRKLLKKTYTIYKQKLLKKYILTQQAINNSVIADGYAGVYRDNNYRNYKTYTTTHVIKIGSSTSWIKTNNELLIGDIELAGGNFDDLIYQLKKIARKLGIKELHFHASPQTTLHTLFAGRFTPIPSFPVIFLNLNAIPIEKIKFTAADIDTF